LSVLFVSVIWQHLANAVISYLFFANYFATKVQICTLFQTFSYSYLFITHQHSIADRGGCFPRHLFVCLSVCFFVNMITSEWLNIGWWNLVVRYIVHKSGPSLNVKVKGQGHWR